MRINLLCVIGLSWVGLYSLPQWSDEEFVLPTVAGAQIIKEADDSPQRLSQHPSQHPSQYPLQHSPQPVTSIAPSITPESPEDQVVLDASVDISTSQTNNKLHQIETESVADLLEKHPSLSNEWFEVTLPLTSQLVAITYELNTSETAPGFDDPGLQVLINDSFVFTSAAMGDDGERRLIIDPKLPNFNCTANQVSEIEDFERQTYTLRIWSGNTGDDQFDTGVSLKQLELIDRVGWKQRQQVVPAEITVEGGWTTVEWSRLARKTEALTALGDRPQQYFFCLTTDDQEDPQSYLPVLPQVFAPGPDGTQHLALFRNLPQPTRLEVIAVELISTEGPASLHSL